MYSEEWGWFVSEEIPYIDDLCIETKRKINKKFNNNKKIESFGLYTIDEEIKEYRPIKKWLIKLDNRFDFGNIFATGISNTFLFCISGVYYLFNNRFNNRINLDDYDCV